MTIITVDKARELGRKRAHEERNKRPRPHDRRVGEASNGQFDETDIGLDRHDDYDVNDHDSEHNVTLRRLEEAFRSGYIEEAITADVVAAAMGRDVTRESLRATRDQIQRVNAALAPGTRRSPASRCPPVWRSGGA